MTSRERVLAAIHHQLPDMVPTHTLGIEDPDKFTQYLGLKSGANLITALGTDLAMIGPAYIGPPVPDGMTIWGTVSHAGNVGYSDSRGGHPLRDATTIAEIERYKWPSPNNLDYDVLEQGSKDAGELARILCFGWQPVFCQLLDQRHGFAMVRHKRVERGLSRVNLGIP